MRDLILMTLVGLICVSCFVRPRIGLYGYTWFALMRPDVLAWSYGTNNYSLAIAVCLLVSSAFQAAIKFPRLLTNAFSRHLILFVLVCIASAGAAIDTSLATAPLTLFLKTIVIVLLAPLLLEDEKSLRTYIVVVAGSMGFLCLKMGGFGLVNGGVWLAQGYGGMIGDNNDLALALAITLPLAWFCRDFFSQFYIKLGWTMIVLAGAAAVIMTRSRGGFLAMSVGMLCVLIFSKRKMTALLVVLVGMGASIYLVRASFVERMSTLTNPLAESSAYSRVVLAKAALNMAKDHPLLGVGFGKRNEEELLADYLPPNLKGMGNKVLHNTYLQVLVDSGVLALLLFLTLIAGALWWLLRLVRKTGEDDPQTASMAKALFAAIITYAVGALFLSRAEFDYFYFLYMAVATLYEVRKYRASLPVAMEAVAAAPGEAQGSQAFQWAGYSGGGIAPSPANTRPAVQPRAQSPKGPPEVAPVTPRMTARQVRALLHRRGDKPE
jgi:probable O-glycosylation ligase (exosortase A-associated)